MMRFKRFSRQRSGTRPPAGRAAALLFAGLAGGCSAQVSGFDFPSFSLNDDPKHAADRVCFRSRQPELSGQRRLRQRRRRIQRSRAPTVKRRQHAEPSPTPRRPQPPIGWPQPATPTYAANGRYDLAASRLVLRRPPLRHGGDDDRFHQPLRSAAAAVAANPGDMIEVQPGDTLYGLSRRHRVGVAELMQVNNLTNPNLQPGQKLYLPQGYAAEPLAAGADADGAACRHPPPPPSVPADLDAEVSRLLHDAAGRFALRHLALAWRVRRRAAAGQRHHRRARAEGRRRAARAGHEPAARRHSRCSR